MALTLTQLDQFDSETRSNLLTLLNQGYSLKYILELKDMLVESETEEDNMSGLELFCVYIDEYVKAAQKVGYQVVQDWEEFYPIWQFDIGEFTGTNIVYCSENYAGKYDSLESFLSHNPNCDECDYIISNTSVFYNNW